jgi:hypothetical protein
MKSLAGLAGAVLMVPLACADTSKTYTVEPFERIEVSQSVDLRVRVGAAQSVVATTSGDDFGRLSVKVVDGTLELGRVHRWYFMDWFDNTHYTVTVSVPVLRSLWASSSGHADVTGPMTKDAEVGASSSGRAHIAEVQGGRIALRASSSGRLELGVVHGDAASVIVSSSGRIAVGELRVPVADMQASSSGVVEASGSCNNLNVRASSSGHVRAAGLRCENVSADVSSSGAVSAFASQGVSANASSSGHVAVAGRPGHVQQHTSSSGTVEVTD